MTYPNGADAGERCCRRSLRCEMVLQDSVPHLPSDSLNHVPTGWPTRWLNACVGQLRFEARGIVTITVPVTDWSARPTGLPSEIYIHGKSPYGPGVFQGGGTGFRWDPNARLQN